MSSPDSDKPVKSPHWAAPAPPPMTPQPLSKRAESDKAVGNVIRKSGSWTPIA